MKQINLLLFALVLILLLSSGASASFTATADETDPFGVWDASTASATISLPSWDGTNYYIAAPASGAMYKNFTTTQNYWKFDINSNNPGVIIADVVFRRDATAANRCQMEFDSAVGSLTVHTSGQGNCAGLADINYPLVKNQWYTFKITDVGSSLRVDILNTTNQTIVKTSTIADIATATSTFFQVSMNQNAFKYDNIFVSTVAETSSTSISWSSTEFQQGAYPDFFWIINDADWTTDTCGIAPFSWAPSWGAIWYHNGEISTTTLGDSSLSIGAQTGSYQINAFDTGTWRVDLVSTCTFLEFGTAITSSSMHLLAQSTSYLLIPDTVFANANTTANFSVGVGGLSALINIQYLNNGIEQHETSYLVTGTGSRNITFARQGTYNVYLERVGSSALFPNLPRYLAPVKTVTSVFVPTSPTHNFSVSNITLSRPFYYMGTQLEGNYTIAGDIFIQGTKFIDIYNTDVGVETTQFYKDGLGETIGFNDAGIFKFYIMNQPALPDAPAVTWYPGNNKARLMLQYGNGTVIELANYSFTLSASNVAGYSLNVHPKSVLVGETVYADVDSPAIGASLQIAGSAGSGFAPLNFSISNNATTITYKFTKAGSYAYFLYDPTGQIQMNDIVTVSNVAISPTSTVSPQQAANEASNAVTTLLTSLTFWAFLMVAGIMMYVGWKTKHYIPTSIVGMSGAGVFTWIGWIPAWLFFSILVIVAYLLSRSQVDKETNVGTQ